MATSESSSPKREAVGVFIDAQHLKAAVDELLASEFERDELGLLAATETIERELQDVYTRINEERHSPNAPATAFVRNESSGGAVHGLADGLFFAGGTAVLGGAVASAAVLGGALFAALAGVAAVGSLGGLLGAIIHQSDAEYLHRQIEQGHLLLFVRTVNPTKEGHAMKVLSRHGAQDVKVLTV